ncbi:efflux RND transporter periplasmic adaptor subunit [Hyphomicrobium sulfonivorans]|uniref:efflux RND transporter periplasmic adaptor subunit n=1 Tax=Hyphomicrobium sulfonivorans TaxID=121290 RepID=UPI0015713331|nr:efflux RND transporter periplasmic adaptor subunit [Hyphomicrobium sulfonivorans]MBI1648391.1 efflux RND transporter periplasmic adaptor subunit [Hyphomicrobium sulfonivorans]NSL71073.1 efflux transporter periplasmic adaptor subunit [Hyphomicrobium sulfonivorans]
MLKRFLITLLILAAFIGGLAYFQFVFKPKMIQEFLSSQRPPPATITAEAASTAEWAERLPAIGTLIASQGVEIAAQVPGIVTELHFESGQDVAAGTKLVQLDISVELADLASAEAVLREAELSFKRQSDLLTKSVASAANVDTARAKHDSAVASLNRIKALIAQKTIIAPFSGRLGIRHVELGQYISPGLAMVSLQALNPIWVDFPMPEQNVDKLSVGQTIELTVDAYPDKVFQGTISSLDARVAKDTRTLLVRGTVPNLESELLPGMFANVTVLASGPQNFVTVPRTAITYSLYGDSIYVLKPAESQPGQPTPAPDAKPVFTVERRFVTTGQVRQDRVAVTSGLTAGEQVATSGQIKLTNGALVTVDNSQAPAPPAERPYQ